MKSGPNTLDKLIKYYEQSTIDSQPFNPKESGINNFNNVETADRKLIVNNKFEFWVHDKVLNENCNYFLTQNNNNDKYDNDDDNNVYSNLSKKKETKNKNLKNKIDICLSNRKRDNFTKQNSKDLQAKIYTKFQNSDYNTFNTISSFGNERTSNNISVGKKKVKKTKSSEVQRKNRHINYRRNNKKEYDKYCITEDLIKINKLREIIKQRKMALGLCDTANKIKDKTPNGNLRNNENKKNANQIKKNTLVDDCDILRNDLFISKTKFGNTISKKALLCKITNNFTLQNIKKNIFNSNMINRNSINKSNNNINNRSINNINNKTINNINNRSINSININKKRKSNGKINDNKNIIIKNNTKSFINITRINISNKNEYDLFFDVLLWMYAKDIKKLRKFAKDFEILLHILSLANFLRLKKNFYNAFLTTLHKNFDMNFFYSSKWARNKISFSALEKIIPLLDGNFCRIKALLLWLKPIKINSKNLNYNNSIIKDIIHSKEFFLVRNYIKKYRLIYSLRKEEIIELKNKFYYFIDCLDMEGIFDKYILCPNELLCLSCHKKFNSLYQIVNKNEEENLYKINNIIYDNPKAINGQYTKINISRNKVNADVKNECQHLIVINNYQIYD